MDQPTTHPIVSSNSPENISVELRSVKDKNLVILSGIFIALLMVIFGLIAYIVIDNNAKFRNSITSFEECANSGRPVMESYPRQCRTSDGRLFVEEIKDESLVTPPEETIKNINIYFSKDPESFDDPLTLYPVIRELNGNDPISFAVSQLIAGPTNEDKENGLFSELVLSGESNCQGMNFEYTVNSKVVTLQFCRKLELSGEMQGARIKEMIHRTLTEINNIEDVIILGQNGSDIFDLKGE